MRTPRSDGEASASPQAIWKVPTTPPAAAASAVTRSAVTRARPAPAATTLALLTLLGPLLAAAASATAAAQAPREPAPDRAPFALQRLPEDRAHGAATITTEDLRGWLGTLTSKPFAGRGTGTEGFARAAAFVATHFEQLGLEPAGDDDSYVQTVPWTRTMADPERTSLRFHDGESTVLELRPGAGMRGTAMADASATGAVVLLWLHDLQEPAFEAGALRDKVVLVAAKGGLQQAVQRSRQGQYALFVLQSRLQQQGAAAVLLVDDARYAASEQLAGLTAAGSRASPAARGRRRLPSSLYLADEHLRQLAAAAGKQAALEQLAAGDGDGGSGAEDDDGGGGRGGGDRTLDLGPLHATLQITTTESQAPAWNVVGVLRGADPARRDEYVVIGSHLDHLGERGGRMYPGADDDASGTTGVLAVSRAFAKNRVRPARSILFVTFCGEEDGLIGSSFFTRHPPIPLESIVAELQMDMIGRNENDAPDNADMLYVVGSEKLSPELHGLVLERNELHAGLQLRIENPQNVFARSDHYNFARHGVPIAFFFTGFHGDYHQPSDTAEKIEYAKLARIVTMVYDLTFELAQRPQRPRVDPALWGALSGKGRQEPAAPLLPQGDAGPPARQPDKQEERHER